MVKSKSHGKRPPGPGFEFDINKMPRSRKAWEAAIQLLNDGKAHHYCEVVYVMLEASDIQPNSCVSLLGQMWKQELITTSEDRRWYSRKIYADKPDVSVFTTGVHTEKEGEQNDSPERQGLVSNPQMEDNQRNLAI